MRVRIKPGFETGLGRAPFGLLVCGLWSTSQFSTHFHHPADVQGILSRIDAANGALLIDDKSHPPGHPRLLIQHSVHVGHLFGEIAQQGELRSCFLGELLLGWPGIDAHRQNFRVVLLKMFDIRLIPLQFPGSTSGKGQHVKGQYNIFLPEKLAEPNRASMLILQFEIWRRIPDPQRAVNFHDAHSSCHLTCPHEWYHSLS